MYRDLIGSVRLELYEAGVGFVLWSKFSSITIVAVHNHQLGFVCVELKLVLSLVRTRFTEILSIGKLLTLRRPISVGICGRTRTNGS